MCNNHEYSCKHEKGLSKHEKGLSKHEKGLSEHEKGLSDLNQSKMYRQFITKGSNASFLIKLPVAIEMCNNHEYSIMQIFWVSIIPKLLTQLFIATYI